MGKEFRTPNIAPGDTVVTRGGAVFTDVWEDAQPGWWMGKLLERGPESATSKDPRQPGGCYRFARASAAHAMTPNEYAVYKLKRAFEAQERTDRETARTDE